VWLGTVVSEKCSLAAGKKVLSHCNIVTSVFSDWSTPVVVLAEDDY